MNLNTVNLYEQLEKIKEKNPSEAILEEVNDLLQSEVDRDNRIIDSIGGNPNKKWINEELLDPDKIYSLDQIQKLCIKYRLRFLDSKHFKGEIPYEAISKIKELEKNLGTELQDFKIIAPKELFKLTDKDSDPILMLPLSKDRFYFIHKWGGDISVLRSIMAFPMRNFMSMFWFLAGLALVFSLLIPTPSFDVFIFLVVHSFIAICGMACMIVMSMRENFSNEEWDSKYLS